MNLQCSFNGIPQIDRAGEYPLLNPDFDFIYQPPTHSLHLYGYDGVLKLNSEEVPFNAGDLTCEATGNSYSIYSEQPTKHWCIHFFSPLQHGSKTFEVPAHIKLGADSIFILEQIKHISHLQNSDSEVEKLEAAFRLKALLLSLHNLENYKKKKNKQSNFMWDELFLLINDNLKSQLSSTWLATQLNISQVTLVQKFKKEYKCTIAKYILRKRIDLAKSLLTTTRYTIGEVGISVGIDDPQYFNKQFRKICGLSPSRYREDNKPYLIRTDDDISTIGGQWKN